MALAGSREPALSAFDPSRVRTAVDRALRSPGPRREFLAWLAARVEELSGGSVSVQERAPDEGPPGCEPVAPELPVRLVVEGEPFAEPAVVRAEDPVVRFPMRG